MTDSRIAELIETVNRLKKGDFETCVQVKGQDEIAELGNSLNDLAKSLHRRYQHLEKIFDITEKVNSGLVLDEVLDYIYESFQTLIPYDRIGFGLLDSQGARVRCRWLKTKSPIVKLEVGYTGELKKSSLKDIIDSGEPRIINDLEEYLREHPDSESTRYVVQEGMRSSLTCPLIARGKPMGFLFFSSTEPHMYDSAHVEIFRHIAEQLSLITEKSILYEEVVELNTVKNRFLGIAAHDLRSPLIIVDKYLEFIDDGAFGEMPESVQEPMAAMRRSCERMYNLISSFLTVSAIESGTLKLEKKAIPLVTFLRDCCEGNRFMAERKSIELEMKLPTELPEVDIDANRIGQAVNNLLSNAIKFSESGTTVILKAEQRDGEVIVSVIDQGPGIPEKEMPKLFSDFGKTSVRPTQGESSTGLGLAIAKRVIEAHNGQISVKSKVGEGSTFAFCLPISQP